VYVPFLICCWSDVFLAGKRFLLGSRPRGNSAFAAVIADAGRGSVDDGLVVDVVDDSGVHAVDRGVVEEVSAIPIAALIANAAISEAVVDAAVESYLRAPPSCIPYIGAVTPAPVARSPQETNLGRGQPRTNSRASRDSRRQGSPVAHRRVEPEVQL
jgi:hypothetical protein